MEQDPLPTLVGKIDSFPTLPIIVTQVIDITKDQDSSAQDLVKVISRDQAITTTILRMANSAFFGMVKKISSLQHAVSILGFKAIRNVVLARSVFRSFKTVGPGVQFDIRKFWEHSFICGLAARILAAEFKGDKNDFFIAGLIHDIGKLVIYMALPMKFSQIIGMQGSLKLRTFANEREVLGITHDDLGKSLLEKWLFPENLITAVGFHHRPEECKEHILFALIVFAADLLAHMSDPEDDPERISALKKELFSSRAKDLFLAQGIEWNESKLVKFQQELDNAKEEETDSISVLFS